RRWTARPPAAAGHAVEAERAAQVEAEDRAQERVPAAEAEADDEEGLDPLLVLHPEVLGGGPDVGRDAGPGGLLDVGHVLEPLAPSPEAGGPPEVVDRDRVDAVLGEAQGQLLEERVEAANVRQDHDPRS